MEQKKQRIIELIEELNRASKAYYQESREIMSNLQYDAKYDELQQLEEVSILQIKNLNLYLLVEVM